MSDNLFTPPDTDTGAGSGLFTPTARAVAALALGVVMLLGQTSITVAVQALLGEHFMANWFFAGFGLAVLVQAALVALLALPAHRRGTGWETHVARASMILALVGLVIGVVTALGSLIHGV